MAQASKMTENAEIEQQPWQDASVESATPHGRYAEACARYRDFITACRVSKCDFRLTPRAEPSAYARCFAVFAMHLVHARDELAESRNELVLALRRDLRAARASTGEATPHCKGYRQLLSFSLSALAILDALSDDPLRDLVEEQLPNDLDAELRTLRTLEGRAQSGNQAMFLAVFLLHAGLYLGRDVQLELDLWLRLHREAMNRFGFWGPEAGPTHLHFQNGYHQYEVLEYLGAENPQEASAVGAVAQLADPDGHFAPYPGGGGCFDYDAVFVLTPKGRVPDDPNVQALLRRTANTIAAEQQLDGGFCENRRVRPRLRALPGFFERLATARNPALLKERARYALALQRPKHDRVHTHWSRYQRQWGESNLWDSWFRMLTLARIACAFDPGESVRWGFIDYPGIGWHPSMRTEERWSPEIRSARTEKSA